MTTTRKIVLLGSLLVALSSSSAFYFGRRSGIAIGYNDGHTAGYKLARMFPESGETKDKDLPPIVEADPSLKLGLSLFLRSVDFDGSDSCSVRMLSIERTRKNHYVGILTLEVPREHCTTFPERIGSFYDLHLIPVVKGQ